MHEFELIEEIRKIIGPNSTNVIQGIGDDAAVLKSPKGNLLTTVDCLVENIHFNLDFSDPYSIGWKSLAVNLSDIAAMGGKPLYALVSLGLREGLDIEFIKEFYNGVKNLADSYSVDIVGGNLTRSPVFFSDITLIGEAENKWLSRKGARSGDLVLVTGELGSSATGLACLKKDVTWAKKNYLELIEKHLKPIPKVTLAEELVKQTTIHSMIDVSDGLSSEIHHLAIASKVGFKIESGKLPLTETMIRASKELGKNPVDFALCGGEDYELLFTIPDASLAKTREICAKNNTAVHVIGLVTELKDGNKIKNSEGNWVDLENKGWNHFKR